MTEPMTKQRLDEIQRAYDLVPTLPVGSQIRINIANGIWDEVIPELIAEVRRAQGERS